MHDIQTQSEAGINTQVEFSNAMETVRQDRIYVINPDEYGELINISHEDARDLPDGLYVVDETIRERIEATGVSYDRLTRAVFPGVNGGSLGTEEGGKVKLSRQSSAHHVFGGILEVESGDRDGPSLVLMVKPHIETAYTEGALSAKPYKEVGNLALLQAIGMEGVYRPVGLLKSEDVKFVLTEFKPGIKTLDDHQWYGRRRLFTSRWGKSKQELAALYDRDIELIAQVCELFGTLHAQGVFHGDAQMKNIGWTSLGVDSEHKLNTSQDLKNVKMTIVDLENASVFLKDPETGDYAPEYYQQLLDLASRDFVQFFGSVPKRSRSVGPTTRHWHPAQGKRAVEPTDVSFDSLFVSLYVESFMEQRSKTIGQQATDSALFEALRLRLTSKLDELNNQKPARKAS